MPDSTLANMFTIGPGVGVIAKFESLDGTLIFSLVRVRLDELTTVWDMSNNNNEQLMPISFLFLG